MQLNSSRTLNELIKAVSLAMDIDEDVKLYHGWRVAVISSSIAERLVPEHRGAVFYSGLLHDVGAVGLLTHIVHYISSDKAFTDPSVISHPLLSAEVIGTFPGLEYMARSVLNHHEAWNGHGYPRGLQGSEIGLESQILHAADFTDIVLRKTKSVSFAEVVSALEGQRNQLLGDRIVEAALHALRDGVFGQVANPDKLDEVYETSRRMAGDITVQRGTDAVGVALDVLSQVIDAKHPYTIGHSRRVARYALLIAVGIGLPHDDVTRVKWAGLLHDVGKLSVPRSLLDKPSQLSKPEYAKLKRHANYTADIVSMVTDLRDAAPIASGHHERYDGNGYPLGLKEHAIPMGARILCVADAFDAMTSHRPYRLNNSIDLACKQLKTCSGTQFDPEVVLQATPILRNLGIVIRAGNPPPFAA